MKLTVFLLQIGRSPPDELHEHAMTDTRVQRARNLEGFPLVPGECLECVQRGRLHFERNPGLIRVEQLGELRDQLGFVQKHFRLCDALALRVREHAQREQSHDEERLPFRSVRRRERLADPDLLQEVEPVGFGHFVRLDQVEQEVDRAFVRRAQVRQVDVGESLVELRGGARRARRWGRRRRRRRLRIRGRERGRAAGRSRSRLNVRSRGSWCFGLLDLHLDFFALVLPVLGRGFSRALAIELPFGLLQFEWYLERLVLSDVDGVDTVLAGAPRLCETEQALLGERDAAQGRVDRRVLLRGTQGESKGREENLDVGRVEEVIDPLSLPAERTRSQRPGMGARRGRSLTSNPLKIFRFVEFSSRSF